MNSAVEKLLGNSVYSSITDLNDISPELIEAARTLNTYFSRREFFSYLVSPSNQDYLMPFILDCVENNTPPHKWLRGRILIPSGSLEDMLTKTRAEILAGIDDQFTHYIQASYEAWKQGALLGGSPAKEEPESTYKSSFPEGMASILGEEIIPRSRVNNSVIHRRWIAQGIARCIDLKEGTVTLEEIIQQTGKLIPESRWVEDVHIALKGFAAEADRGFIKEGFVPGFILPDEYYL
jgi:hypothetical protein